MTSPERTSAGLPAAGAPGLPALGWAGLAGLVPAVAGLLIALAPPLNHDVAAILGFAARMLAGEPLYARLIDANPPLVFLLALPAAAIGGWTGWGPVAPLLASILGVAGLSAWLARAALPDRATAPAEASALALGLPTLMLAAGYDFGQREHLMVIAALPYLLVAAHRLEGGATPAGARLGGAALAALGFALKPHALLIPLLVEAAILLRRGPARALRDPVPWLMAAIWVAYAALIALAFPAYLTQVLPLLRGAYLPVGGLAWWQVALTERLGTALMLLVPLGLVVWRADRGGLPVVLALAGAGAALAAILQGKGWTYHALPVRLLAALLAVVLAARWLDRVLGAGAALGRRAAIAAVGAWAIGLVSLTGAEAPWREITWTWSRAGELSALLRREVPAGERILVLSPDVFPVYPALTYAGLQDTLRTMTVWPVQAAYQECLPGYRPADRMPGFERAFFDATIADFAARPPRAILVARHSGTAPCAQPFDLLAYFARDPGFAATLARYREVGTVEGYRLLRRGE